MLYVASAFGLLAALSWLVALASWVLAIMNRKPEISLAQMFFRGHLAFDASNFTEVGAKHQRRFMIGFACFFLAIFGSVGVSLFAS